MKINGEDEEPNLTPKYENGEVIKIKHKNLILANGKDKTPNTYLWWKPQIVKMRKRTETRQWKILRSKMEKLRKRNWSKWISEGSWNGSSVLWESSLVLSGKKI